MLQASKVEGNVWWNRRSNFSTATLCKATYLWVVCDVSQLTFSPSFGTYINLFFTPLSARVCENGQLLFGFLFLIF